MRAIDLINKLKAYSNSDENWKNAEVTLGRDYRRKYLILVKESGDRLSIDLGEVDD